MYNTVLIPSGCQLRILAVGGGGIGDNHHDKGGGGGSGFLQYYTLETTSHISLNLTVGNDEEASVVSISNGVEIDAAPGTIFEMFQK